MSEEVSTEIIETGPINDTPNPVSEDAISNAIPEKEEAPSIDEALEKAFAKATKPEPEKAEDKPAKTEKPEKAKEEDPKPKEEEDTKPKARAADGKFAPAEKAEGKEGEAETAKDLQSEGKSNNVPSRLLPSEKEQWHATPRRLKEAFHRLESEVEASAAKYEPAVKFHDELKEFDDLAKKSGTTVKAALANFVNAENAIRQDFGRGIAQMAQAMGKNPTEAVAQIMRASGVSPQQLGAYLQGQPAQAQQAQQAPKPDATAQAALQRVQQLENMLLKQQQEAESAARLREVEEKIIGPAMAEMPRFEELQGAIAKLLKSDIIATDLSPELRLREAYFAADRMNPALQRSYENDEADLDLEASKVATLPRKKQISGSPATNTSRTTKKGPAPSIDEALERALRNATR